MPVAWTSLVVPFVGALVWLGSAYTDVVAYNGFDVPIVVKIDQEGQLLQPGGHAEWDLVRRGPARFEAYTEEGQLFEAVDVQLDGSIGEDAVYNVASRGVLHTWWVRYGEDDSPIPEGEVLPPGNLHFVRASHFFVEPPQEKKVRERDYVDEQVLQAMELSTDARDAYLALMGEGLTAHAEALVEAERKLRPDDSRLRLAILQQRLETAADPAEQQALAAEIRTARDQSPDDVGAHQLYQDFGQIEPEALRQEYEARLAERATPMAHYLLGRLLVGEAALAQHRAALVIEPSYRPALLEVGVLGSELGLWEEAFAALNRHGADGLDPWARDLVHRLALVLELPTAFPSIHMVPVGTQLALVRGQRTVEQVLAELGLPPDELQRVEPQLRLAAGQLDRVRERLQQEQRFELSLLLAMSDGATEADQDRALALLGDQTEGAVFRGPGEMLLAWGLLARAAPDRLKDWEPVFEREPAFVHFLELAGGKAGLKDLDALEKRMKAGIPMPYRGRLYVVASWLYPDDPTLRERVRRFTLPLERPWSKP